MGNPLARVITNHIFNVPARRKRKVEVKPSDIPTFHYTVHLADVRWLRRAARRKIA
ncbi:NinE family protein [Enterobacter hormaechei]|uniref:NinE family protein n=1 Tax=Enterobacter hormaechei TaxID=158836 RepID=UPI001BE4393C|nr:NinE family protein [Enterobacter hormaechei]MBT2206247.1 NinE family protein [Enterobacter hormaechei subsp. xiangfangensis]